MKDVPMEEQFALNIDQKRLDKKILLYEAQARERKKAMKKIGKKDIGKRVDQLMKTFFGDK